MAATRVILALNPGMDAKEWQQSLASAGLEITAICSHGADARIRLNAGEADTVLVSDLIPGLTRLQGLPDTVKILVLSHPSQGKEPDWRALIGADQILPIQTPYTELAAAVQRLVAQSSKAPISNRLTDLEIQALDLLAEGLTDDRIGLRLGVGGKALRYLMDILMIKLGVSSRLEMMVLARRWQLFG